MTSPSNRVLQTVRTTEGKPVGKLENKVAIVTGAGRGIGAATARRLAAEGAKVVLTDLREAEGEAVAHDIGPHARFLRHDVTCAEDWAGVMAGAGAAFGPVTVLVNNAGIVGQRYFVDEFPLEEYRKVIEVNQIGVLLGMQSVTPSMIKAGGGSIVNIASVVGLVAGPQSAAYCASKFAVTGMTKVAALDLARHRIRVNSVHPGAIRTPLLADSDADGALTAFAQSTASGRLGEPGEIAAMVAFLASDDAAYCVGGTYIVDGGWTAV